MASLFPQALVEDLRALDLVVAGIPVNLAHVLLDDLPDLPTLRMPEDEAGCFFLEMEQVQLPGQLAVIALLRLLDAQDVGGELLPVGPGRAIDALQLLVLRIATPVRAGNAGQLEGLEEARVRHVRTTAHVEIILMVVEAHRLFVGHVLDQAQLVILATRLERGNHLVARRHLLDDVVFGVDQLGHACFDRRQILRRERALEPDVVEKTFLDDRADDHLRAREQLLDRMANQMRAGVADDLDAFLVLRRDDLQAGVVVDAVTGIDELAIDLAGDGRLGQARADRSGHVLHADRIFELTDAAVGERDVDHGKEDSGIA